MPGGDRTGPMGNGPMTGRAMGNCAQPVERENIENQRPGFGRGFGMGMARGAGFGMGRGMRCGFGRRGGGFRNWGMPPVNDPQAK